MTHKNRNEPRRLIPQDPPPFPQAAAIAYFLAQACQSAYAIFAALSLAPAKSNQTPTSGRGGGHARATGTVRRTVGREADGRLQPPGDALRPGGACSGGSVYSGSGVLPAGAAFAGVALRPSI